MTNRSGSGGTGPRHDHVHNPDPDIVPSRERPYAGFNGQWWDEPYQRRRALLRTFVWTFVPHTKNSGTRKIVTSVLMGTWSLITIGQAFGFAETGQYYPWITLLVLSIVCTLWGFELGVLSGVAGTDIKKVEENNDE